MAFAVKLQEEMRLVILRLLSEMPQYRSNSSLITSGLDQYGLSFSRDQVKTELHWLAQQTYIDIEDDLPTVMVVKLTERGADVASGRSRVNGVQRPSA